MTDEQDFGTGFGDMPERLTVAFRDQADRFEPSNDAYARLAEAVNRPGPTTSSTGWFRPALATAAVVMVLGGGAALVARQDTLSIDTDPAGDAAGVDVADDEGSGGGDDESSSVAADGSEEDDGSLEATLVDPDESAETLFDGTDAATDRTGPVAGDPVAAAQALLDELGIPFLDLEAREGGQVAVFSRSEGATDDEPGFEVAVLDTVEVDGGVAAVRVRSERVEIESVRWVGGGRSTLRVTGVGSGFESTLDVALVSVYDGRRLADTSATGGQSEPEPFEVDLPVSGVEQAWLVVSSSGGADGVTDPFTVVPLDYTAVNDPDPYVVIGIRPDDPDDGLVVRDEPGVVGNRIGLVPPGADGVTRNGEFPVLVGDDVWWSVTTPAGQSGWVNSRFLASGAAIGDDALQSVAASVVEVLPLLEAPSADSAADRPLGLPFSSRLPITFGFIAGPEEDLDRTLARTGGWFQQRTFDFPPERQPTFDGSLLELLEVERWGDAPIIETHTGADATSYPANRSSAERLFGQLPAVSIVADDSDTPWTRTVVYVEPTPAGPEIIAIVAEPWVP